jgi:hypothetical protein
MTKHYCDCCGQEITAEISGHHFNLLCHTLVNDITSPMAGHVKIMSNGTMEKFSRREVVLLLCLTCYNNITHVTVAHLKELREINNNTNPLPT